MLVYVANSVVRFVPAIMFFVFAGFRKRGSSLRASTARLARTTSSTTRRCIGPSLAWGCSIPCPASSRSRPSSTRTRGPPTSDKQRMDSMSAWRSSPWFWALGEELASNHFHFIIFYFLLFNFFFLTRFDNLVGFWSYSNRFPLTLLFFHFDCTNKHTLKIEHFNEFRVFLADKENKSLTDLKHGFFPFSYVCISLLWLHTSQMLDTFKVKCLALPYIPDLWSCFC